MHRTCSPRSFPARSPLLLLALAATLLNGCAALRGTPDGRVQPPPSTAVTQADPAPAYPPDPPPPVPPRPLGALAQRTGAGAAWVWGGVTAGYRHTRDGVEAAMDSPVVPCVLFPLGLAVYILRGGSSCSGSTGQ